MFAAMFKLMAVVCGLLWFIKVLYYLRGLMRFRDQFMYCLKFFVSCLCIYGLRGNTDAWITIMPLLILWWIHGLYIFSPRFQSKSLHGCASLLIDGLFIFICLFFYVFLHSLWLSDFAFVVIVSICWSIYAYFWIGHRNFSVFYENKKRSIWEEGRFIITVALFIFCFLFNLPFLVALFFIYFFYMCPTSWTISHSNNIVLEKESESSPIFLFLQQNLTKIFLFLGISFIAVGMLVLLHSKIAAYKTLCLSGLISFILLCFLYGFYLYFKRNKFEMVYFSLFLLGSLFVPFSYYFALQYKLLVDVGNHFGIFAITSCLFFFFTFLLKKVTYAILGIAFCLATQYVFLQPYFPDPSFWEYFGVLFVGQSFLFYIISRILIRYRVLSDIFQYAAHILYIFCLCSTILYGNSLFLMIVCIAGFFLALFSITLFTNPDLQRYVFFIFPLLWIASVFSICHYCNMDRWIICFVLSCAIFLLMYLKNWYESLCTKESLSARWFICQCLPFLLVIIYYLGNPYRTQSDSLWLWMSLFIFVLIYIQAFFEKQNYISNSLSIIMRGLLLWETLHLFQVSHYSNYSFIFLGWALLLNVVAFIPKIRSNTYIFYPMYYASLIIAGAVLSTFVIVGKIHYSFAHWAISLIFSILLFANSAYQKKNRYMMYISALLFIYFCHVSWHHYFESHFLNKMVFFCSLSIILGFIAYLKKESIVLSKTLFRISHVVFLSSSGLAIVATLGQLSTQIQIIVLLGFLYYAILFYVFQRSISLFCSISYLVLGYVLNVYTVYHYYHWGSLLLLPNVMGIAIWYAVNEKFEIVGNVIYKISMSLFWISFALFFLDFYTYKSLYKVGHLYIYILLISSLDMLFANRGKNITLYLYANIAIFLALYTFRLPESLSAIEYSCFYMPIAIIFLIIHLLGEKEKTPWLYTAKFIQYIVLAVLCCIYFIKLERFSISFLLFNFFIFYAILLYYKTNIFHCICTVFFLLLSICIPLYLTPSFPQQHTFCILTILCFFIALATLYLEKKEKQEYSKSLLFLNQLILSISTVFICIQIPFTTSSIFSFLLISLCFGIFSFLNIKYKDIYAFVSVIFFCVSYVLFFDIAHFSDSVKYWQYILLASISLVAAILLQKQKIYSRVFLIIMVVAPFLSLFNKSTPLFFTIYAIITSIIYGLAGIYFKNVFLSHISIIFFVLGNYSALYSYQVSSNLYLLLSLFLGQFFLCLQHITKNLHWKKYIPLYSMSCYAIFFALYFILATNQFSVAYMTFCASILLFIFQKKTKQYSLLPSILFLFSYYTLLMAFDIEIWEFYTIPFGIFLLAVHHLYEEIFSKTVIDLPLYACLLIFVPTLIQSFQGWHLTTPHNHIYYTILLSIQSMIAIVYGIQAKKATYLLCGTIFLLCEICLLIFTYIPLQGVPLAAWWAFLGVILLSIAYMREYKKEFSQKYIQKILHILKTYFL
ncbi:MAG TPA: hypothetical protein PLB63_06150 [Planctomycetota bacterium]|nr:hypothetical protein [Planctomycetota bacterium]